MFTLQPWQVLVFSLVYQTHSYALPTGQLTSPTTKATFASSSLFANSANADCPTLAPLNTENSSLFVFDNTFRRRLVKGYKKCRLVKMVSSECDGPNENAMFHESGRLVPGACTWRTVCKRYTNRWPAEKKSVACRSSSSASVQSYVCGFGRVTGRCQPNKETIKVLRLAVCRRRLNNGKLSRRGRLEMIEVEEDIFRSCSCMH